MNLRLVKLVKKDVNVNFDMFSAWFRNSVKRVGVHRVHEAQRAHNERAEEEGGDESSGGDEEVVMDSKSRG